MDIPAVANDPATSAQQAVHHQAPNPSPQPPGTIEPVAKGNRPKAGSHEEESLFHETQEKIKPPGPETSPPRGATRSSGPAYVVELQSSATSPSGPPQAPVPTGWNGPPGQPPGDPALGGEATQATFSDEEPAPEWPVEESTREARGAGDEAPETSGTSAGEEEEEDAEPSRVASQEGEETEDRAAGPGTTGEEGTGHFPVQGGTGEDQEPPLWTGQDDPGQQDERIPSQRARNRAEERGQDDEPALGRNRRDRRAEERAEAAEADRAREQRAREKQREARAEDEARTRAVRRHEEEMEAEARRAAARERTTDYNASVNEVKERWAEINREAVEARERARADEEAKEAEEEAALEDVEAEAEHEREINSLPEPARYEVPTSTGGSVYTPRFSPAAETGMSARALDPTKPVGGGAPSSAVDSVSQRQMDLRFQAFSKATSGGTLQKTPLVELFA